MSEQILGRLRCEYCGSKGGERIELGTVGGEPVMTSIALRDVIREASELFWLSCGHSVHKLQGALMLSAQEWLRDYPQLTGHLPLESK